MFSSQWEPGSLGADPEHDLLSFPPTNSDHFDLARAGIPLLEQIPLRYIMALIRAWTVMEPEESIDVMEVRDCVADEFERLVKSLAA